MKNAKDHLVAQIDADIAKLQAMRAYVLERAVAQDDAPKVKRGRKKKAGLPGGEAQS